MRFKFSGFKALKLHTKTMLLISALLVVVFAVIAYFYDGFTTHLSNDDEVHKTELLATYIADTVEHHIKRERKRVIGKSLGKGRVAEEESFEPDWTEVQDEIKDTLMKNPQFSEVRVYRNVSPSAWDEAVRLPEDAGPPFLKPPFARIKVDSATQNSSAVVLWYGQQGQTRLVTAMARAFSLVDYGSPRVIALVTVTMAFDENTSVAARLRRLVWPLMALAIVAITLITYILFSHIIYNPIESLLVAMSRAEEGDLTVEAKSSAPDEIGLLTSRFNRMLTRIRGMTDQLNLHQRRLEERVSEATAEIAERKEQLEEANLELFQMQRQLTQLERLAAAGQLAAQFAHEVGTPLNLISGHVQLLRARTSDERLIKRLDVIADQIERITSIVRSMLDSTRRPKPKFEPVDLNTVIMRIVDATQPTLAARGVNLQTSLQEELPKIEADPDQLQQVFINLINNSIDAMPGGGTLNFITRAEDDRLVIELSDSGEGIKRDQIDLIFDPLFSTKHGKGTGLGLTIVKQIIVDHAGTIEVQSEPGLGTLFRITLPVLPGPTGPDEEAVIEKTEEHEAVAKVNS